LKKNICKRLQLLIVTASLFISPVLIQAQQSQRNSPSGWFFSVGLGLVQIETEAMTQEKLQSYEDEPEKETALLLWPMLGLTYLDEGGGQWFFGTLDETLGFERRQPTPIGWFTISYGIGYFDILKLEIEGQEYENPYELGSRRETTTTNIIKKKLSYSVGRGINLTFNYHQDQIFYGEDKTTEISDDLGRNALIETVSGHLRLWFLSLGQERKVQLAEGKADSFNAVYDVFSVRLPIFKSNLSVEAYSKSGTDTYGNEHPVFSKTREDSISKRQIQLNFDFVTWNVFLIHYEEQVESNIDFFNEKKIMQGFGVSFLF
jgi:hypothetical protein